MSESHNPIVRTFCRLRAVLVNDFGVPRQCVRPEVRIDELVYPAGHPRLCKLLRGAGIRAPEVGERQVEDYPFLCGSCLVVPLLLFLPVVCHQWIAGWITGPLVFLLSFALVWAAFKVKRTRTVTLTLMPRTIGELVIYLIRLGDYREYRFSRNEIALKVRMLVAERLGIDLDHVTEKDNFIEDFA